MNALARSSARPGRWLALLAGVLLACMLGGCASGPGANPADPMEPLNRRVNAFNEGLDRIAIKPAAMAYQAVTPRPVRTGVSNFFNNLQDVWSFFNNVLQFKGQAAADSFTRVGVNTFIGLGGLLDVAGEMNIERHTEDFGQTLGRWGVPSGPYLVLPVLGPSTVRDTAALGVDLKGDVLSHAEPVSTRNTLTALRVLDTRARLLRAGNVLDEAALDKYSFARDAYLQRRRALILDGEEPPEPERKP
ncbi:MAG: VacJ family lipoprotein [Ramlibacter sp.]|jgi:phospholipid-binding lipoprotein MlaA|nr:VacJ family lipoprotein [Ramlibacter sp.]